MAKIHIDGKTYEVSGDKNLLEVCLSLGFDLPYFCWHPAMGSVGACRQCAVLKYRDENDRKGKLSMACMEPVSDDLRISIEEKEAVQFRSNVIEWLMVNHPHDCPVCDEGGECHLQDMTVMTGHNYRRYDFKKRTHRNQYLGPFINHEMNRCIQCYRCVRFYREHADGRDFNVFSAHDHVYFGRHKDGVLENEFSGNLVEICPTGVFTDKTLKDHYTRKWDMTTAPSICNQCGLGCNIIAAERYGSLRRILSRFNGQVNGYFLCDRGRFGYEYVNDPERIREPIEINKQDGTRQRMSAKSFREKCDDLFGSGKRLAAIGSPRASLEANYALQLLVSRENFYAGLTGKELSLIRRMHEILKSGPVPSASMKEIGDSDAVFVLGEDLTNTAPMLALAVRQASRRQPAREAEKLNVPRWQDAAVREIIQDNRGPVFIAAPSPTRLDDIATEKYRAVAPNIARLGFAVAHFIDPDAPSIDMSPSLKALARKLAGQLLKADRPVIISGASQMDISVVEAAANIARAIYKKNKQVKLSFTVPEANSMGLVMMSDKSLDDLVEQGKDAPPDVLVILENDLYRRLGYKQTEHLLQSAGEVIVLDHLMNRTAAKADYVVPVGTFAESDGTCVNNEGRAQRFYQVYKPEGEIWESWRWLSRMSKGFKDEKGRELNNFFDFVESLTGAYPVFDGIQHITPPPGFRVNGQKIPRESHRFSGRTAMHAHEQVSESAPPDDPDSPLSYTMEGYNGKPPSSLIPFFWSPGWNSVQSINKYQIEVGGPLHGGDPGLRLLEPEGGDELKYGREIPGPVEFNGKDIYGAPVYHIFGSEELSVRAPGIAGLSPESYVGMDAALAKHLNAGENAVMRVHMDNSVYELKARIMKGIPEGTALLPLGLNGLPAVLSDPIIRIEKSHRE